jgi:hypothetical protein
MLGVRGVCCVRCMHGVCSECGGFGHRVCCVRCVRCVCGECAVCFVSEVHAVCVRFGVHVRDLMCMVYTLFCVCLVCGVCGVCGARSHSPYVLHDLCG